MHHVLGRDALAGPHAGALRGDVRDGMGGSEAHAPLGAFAVLSVALSLQNLNPNEAMGGARGLDPQRSGCTGAGHARAAHPGGGADQRAEDGRRCCCTNAWDALTGAYGGAKVAARCLNYHALCARCGRSWAGRES